ncbi:TylF/MycF family methyltransferase [Methylomagnum ishizawai]|uniref:TylF/MycF family methyltransferase n=1 Tax=Methylomagnum ishizawai TaxID=1760988 RepID=UPI001C324C7A|nr:TylF/MycF family methyltransferase [Methylomagnum ishizawai]BBL76956.1 methyltransferase [Methylomagnum ishizawai]
MKQTRLPELSIADPNGIHNFKSHRYWGVKDPKRFAELMEEATTLVLPGYHLGDNQFVWTRNLSMLDDAAFRTAWEANAITASDQAIVWRRYVLCCAAYHCVHLEGDFVECGTLSGTGVKTVIDYFGKDHFAKNFWAYDTFDTNPVEDHHFEGQGEGLFLRVQQRFAGYDQVNLIPGLLPNSLFGNSPCRIAYLHIDLNKAEYEIAVLETLFDRVVPGGIVILDDYEWSGVYRSQKIKEDVWFAARNYRIIPLPTGQGLILKR